MFYGGNWKRDWRLCQFEKRLEGKVEGEDR